MNRLRLTRRALINAFVKCGCMPLLINSQKTLAETSQPNNSTSAASAHVTIVVPATDERRVRRIVDESGASTLPGSTKYEPPVGEKLNSTDPNFAPLLSIVAVVSAGYLAKIIFGLWREVHYPGLVVTVINGQVTIKENQALTGGTVVVVRSDGAQILTPPNESELTKVLEHVIRP